MHCCLFNEEVGLHITHNHSSHNVIIKLVKQKDKVQCINDGMFIISIIFFNIFFSRDLSMFYYYFLYSNNFFHTSDKEKTKSWIWYYLNNSKKKKIYLNIQVFLESSVSDEDKHCYACKDGNDECITPCHWTQRCYIKARHANATS